MAARAPRRSFAAPFVLTLAAVPACTVSSGPPSGPPPQQPATQQPVAQTPTQPPPTQPQPTWNPPPPSQPEPQAPPQPEPPVVANPPRPTGNDTATTPEPSTKTVTHWHVEMDASTKQCTATLKLDCPMNAKCKMPPRNPYACPAGWDGVGQVTVTRFANTTECVLEAPIPKCPPNAKCKRPAGTKVPCPT